MENIMGKGERSFKISILGNPCTLKVRKMWGGD